MTRFVALILILIAGFAQGKSYDVVVGWSKPPYVIADGNTGFELELAKTIFSELGHSITPIYVPFGRAQRLFNEDNKTIVLTMNFSHAIDSTKLSDPYVVYQNAAISLAKDKLNITQFEDLNGHSVAAFQTANRVLGKAYADVVNHHPHYLELAEQSRQVSLLLLEHVDVLIMDRNIFHYLQRQLPPSLQLDVIVHPLFRPTAYRAAIFDDELRADFNRVLASMIADGRYQLLLDRFHLTNLLHEASAKALD